MLYGIKRWCTLTYPVMNIIVLSLYKYWCTLMIWVTTSLMMPWLRRLSCSYCAYEIRRFRPLKSWSRADSRLAPSQWKMLLPWWRHQTETFSALLAICAGNSPVTGELPAPRLVTQSFDVFFDLCLNNRLSKQSWGWWFEMPLCPLWHHCNVFFKQPCYTESNCSVHWYQVNTMLSQLSQCNLWVKLHCVIDAPWPILL